jgi:hypothetical protein
MTDTYKNLEANISLSNVPFMNSNPNKKKVTKYNNSTNGLNKIFKRILEIIKNKSLITKTVQFEKAQKLKNKSKT